MNLVIDDWTNTDLNNFNNYLYSIRREDKISFTKKIINTKLEVLGIPNPVLRNISKELIKGNFLSYLDLNNSKYYESTIIYSLLINNIKDIKTKKKYLSKLVCDNWATCDALSFKVKGKEQDYLNLSKSYLKKTNPFKRRIAIRILFGFEKTSYINEMFDIIDTLEHEKAYYVNMIVAWLLCDLFIYHREETIKFLDNNKLNTFTINKMISKCRDSFRVSKSDKEMLLKYKVKE